ncbi:MAG: DUF11 domain-containing protein [Planctomycetes bacterium]|nr:DUF11 domain-containing protein [Planctomycetota bacterium]
MMLAALAAPQIGRAGPVPLVFQTCTPTTNVADMGNGLGPGYTEGPTLGFLGVATHEGTTVDARVTAVVQPNTGFATGAADGTALGFLPNYNATTTGRPNGGLGLLYEGLGKGTSGITVTISFFNGIGDLCGTFSQAYALPEVALLVYDVDGEPAQAEWLEAFYADGLYSHAVGAAARRVTVTATDPGVFFRGPGRNVAETDTSGAVILHYRNTSRITLAFGAEQYRDGRNPVFSAIDGNAGLPMTGGFQDPMVVPVSHAVTPMPPAAPRPSAPVSAARLYSADGVIRLERQMPAEVALNTAFDYTIQVTNVTDTAVDEVVVTERVPRNFKVQKSDPPTETEDIDLVWQLGVLAPKATQEMRVWGLATSAERLRPCATVSFRAPICTDVAVVEPKLTLSKTMAKEVLLGEPVSAQIVVTNSGSGAVHGVKIVDTLPAGLQMLDGSSELVLEAGTLEPGKSKQFAGTFQASKTGELVTQAVATSSSGLRAEATASVVVRQPVLALTQIGPARQYVGRPATYEITVTNKGDAPAAGTMVEALLPEGVQAIQTSPAGTVSGAKVVWPLGTLAVDASKKVSLTCTPAQAGTLTATARATAGGADPATATTRTTVYGIAAVLLEVMDTDDPVEVGGETTYVIVATNQGSQASTNVQITCRIEEPQQFVSAAGATVGTLEGQTILFAPLPTLAAQAKATWRVVVKAVKPGDVRFWTAMNTTELERCVEETEATQQYELD